MSDMKLTRRGKAVVFIAVTAIVAGLTFATLATWQGDRCEALYDAYLSSSDLGERVNLLNKVTDTGCFHN